MTTAYPTQPFTDFKHWKIFILGQNAIYEGRDLVRHDLVKPFTINEEHLARVNKAKKDYDIRFV